MKRSLSIVAGILVLAVFAVIPARADTVAATIAIAADNSAALYVNGNYVGTNTNWSAATTYNADFIDGENIIAIKGVDADALGAVLCEATVGDVTYRTDSSWLVSTASGMTGWEVAGYDTTGWVAARECAAWGSGAWGTKTTGISRSSETKWIWSSSDADQTTYFRKSIMISVPSSTTTSEITGPSETMPVTSTGSDNFSIGALTFTKNSVKGGWDADFPDLGTVNFQLVSDHGQSGLQATVGLPNTVTENGVMGVKNGVTKLLAKYFQEAFKEPSEIRLKIMVGLDVNGGIKNILSPSIGIELPFGVNLDPTRPSPSYIMMYAGTSIGFGLVEPQPGISVVITAGLEDGETWNNMYKVIPANLTALEAGVGLVFTPVSPIGVDLEYGLFDFAFDVTSIGKARFKFELDKSNPANNEIEFYLEAEALNNYISAVPDGNVGQAIKNKLQKLVADPYAQFLTSGVMSVLKNADNGVTINRLGFRLAPADFLSGKTPTFTGEIGVHLDGVIDKDFGVTLGTQFFNVSGSAKAEGAKMAADVAEQVYSEVKDIIGNAIDITGAVGQIATSVASDVSAVSTKMGSGAASFATNYAGRVGQIASKAANKIAKFGRKKKHKDGWDTDYDAWNLRCAQAAEVALAEYKAVIDSNVLDYTALFELSPKTRTEREVAIQSSWAALQTEVTAGINNLYLTTNDQLTPSLSHTKHKRQSKYDLMRATQTDLYGSALATLTAYMVTQKEAVVSGSEAGADGAESYGVEKDTVAGVVTFAADNYAELYVNGEYIGNCGNWKAANNFSVEWVDGENIIAIKATDADQYGGLLAEALVAGSPYYRSNSDWYVSTTLTDGWEQADFDTSTGWVRAREIASYGSGVWGNNTIRTTGSSLNKWIWSASDNDQAVYFRRIINVVIP